MGKMFPEYKQISVIKKFEGNPILTKDDIPYEASLVFNAGVAKLNGKYYMVFRNDYGTDESVFPDKWWEGTSIGVAESDDGIHWVARSNPLIDSNEFNGTEIKRYYDPRLTVIDGELYICFAVDTNHGIRGGVGKLTNDLTKLEVLSLSAPDNRNMVLFPEKINGLYTRLERPLPMYFKYGHDAKFDIWSSQSPDLKFWGNTELVLTVDDVSFANDKLGPAAPPIKTKKGWLALFHAVEKDKTRGKNGWENTWNARYFAGLMLLDLNDPSKVIGICKDPVLTPEKPYETDEGFRQHVIFPGGMILEDDGTVKIYYGASDTVECLATAKVDDLLELCK